jgi:type II secretory pathway component PulM
MLLSETTASGQAPFPLPAADEVAARASDLARDLQALAASGQAVDLPDTAIQDLMSGSASRRSKKIRRWARPPSSSPPPPS